MEPLSAFSLSLAILNILLNTIAGIYDKGDQILSYKDKLMRFKRVLDDCSVSFQLWYAIWERKDTGGAGDSSFQIIFGAKGWQEVKASKLALEQYIERLQRHLCLKELPEEVATPKLHPSKLSKTPPIKRVKQSDRNGNISKEEHARSSGFLSNFFSSKAKEAKRASKLPTRESLTLRPVTPETASLAGATQALGPDAATGTMVAANKNGPASKDADFASQIQAWGAYTESLETWSQAQPDPSIMRRVIGILGPNQRLDRLVSDLKEEVDRLHRISANHYRIMGHGKEQPKQAEDLEPTLRKFSFWDLASKISTSSSPFRQEHESSKNGWHLELHFPEKVSDSKTLINQIITYCRFRFMVNTKSSTGTAFVKEVGVLQRQGKLRGAQETHEDVKEALSVLFSSGICNFRLPSSMEYQLKALDKPKSVTKDWQCLLAVGSQTPTVRKAFDLARARLAYGFVIWMILLWNTSWFTHICACTFRSVVFEIAKPTMDPQQSHAVGGTEESPSIPYRQENVYLVPTTEDANNTGSGEDVRASEQICEHIPSTNDRLYHCGLLLCALLLGEPINANADTDELAWRIEREVPGDAWMAVRFCFLNGEKDPWNKSSSYLATGNIDTLLDDVVKPIKDYYDTTKEHFPESNAKNFIETALAQADAGFG